MFFMFLCLRNVRDPNNVIDWDVIQVEYEGEFQTEPQFLDKKVTFL